LNTLQVIGSINPLTLRFLVKVCRLSHLCGCSTLDVGGPSGSLRDLTVVSRAQFDKRYDQPLCRRVQPVPLQINNDSTSDYLQATVPLYVLHRIEK